MNRLEQLRPQLANQLAALPVYRQWEIAVRAAIMSLKSLGMPIPDEDEDGMVSAVERLDLVAWDIQDRESAAPGEYEAAFRRARAVNSLLLAQFGDNPVEAIYEALHALGMDPDLGPCSHPPRRRIRGA